MGGNYMQRTPSCHSYCGNLKHTVIPSFTQQVKWSRAVDTNAAVMSYSGLQYRHINKRVYKTAPKHGLLEMWNYMWSCTFVSMQGCRIHFQSYGGNLRVSPILPSPVSLRHQHIKQVRDKKEESREKSRCYCSALNGPWHSKTEPRWTKKGNRNPFVTESPTTPRTVAPRAPVQRVSEVCLTLL